MKYVIVGYTSDIDIKTNTAKIRYAKIHFAKTELFELFDQIPVLDDWVDDVREATAFHSRDEADEIVYDLMHMTSNSVDFGKPYVISYGIAE